MIYKKTWKYILILDNTYYCTRKNYYRLMAIKDFSDVSKGDRGGYVISYHNLSQKGECWVYDEARICDNARVYGKAKIHREALVSGKAKVFGNAIVTDNAYVCGDAVVFGNSYIGGYETRCC